MTSYLRPLGALYLSCECHGHPGMAETEQRMQAKLGLKSLFPSIYSYPCKFLLRTTCVRQQTSGQWDAEMKHIIYGGDAGTENDISWGSCPKTRRQVTGKVRVITSILQHQRKATWK